MGKRLTSIVSALILVFSLVSPSGGFDNNKENFEENPATKRKEPIPYTPDNINNGRLKGGHDSITAEGAILKKQVHQGDKDFERFVDQALPSLRTGAHDEDSTIPLLDDPPIGPNGWGNFFKHFYDPITGCGLKCIFQPAPERAKDYAKEIKKLLCKLQKAQGLSEEEKKKLYDYFGRILHLLEDMGNPAHTQDDIHVWTKTIEDYVRDNWKEAKDA